MSHPKISIVTPSLNHAPFIEETLRTVLGQNYPALEYIVMDGGSTDGTVEIIRQYENQIARWNSEPDRGQYDAINKGLAMSSGEIMGWLNSDDIYLPKALAVVGEIFDAFPKVEWITSLFPLCIDAEGRPVHCRSVSGYSRKGFLRGENLPGGSWHAREAIQQESTFWRRSLWERAGGFIDPKMQLAGDFDLWCRFFKADAILTGVPVPLAGFRFHPSQKTDRFMSEYLKEARESLLRHGGREFSGLESWRLRKLGKLSRIFSSRYEQALRGGDRVQICVHKGRNGGWELKGPE